MFQFHCQHKKKFPFFSIHGFPTVELLEVVEREANHNSQLIKTIKECPISYPIKDEAENTIKCLIIF